MTSTRSGIGLLGVIVVLASSASVCFAIGPLDARPCPADQDDQQPFDFCDDALPGEWYGGNHNIHCGSGSRHEQLYGIDPPPPFHFIFCHTCIPSHCYDVPPDEFCECLSDWAGGGWFHPDIDPEPPAFHELWSFYLYDANVSCDAFVLRPCYGWPSGEAGSPTALESTWGRVKAQYR